MPQGGHLRHCGYYRTNKLYEDSPHCEMKKAPEEVTHKLNCLTSRLRRSTLGFSMFRLLEPESCEELGYLR